MGQNSSTSFQRSSQPFFPKRKSQSYPAPPIASQEEVATPTTPSYAVAENKVLPNGGLDMRVARKLLRPVSQELTKFHPDYADIFPATQGDDNSFMDASLHINFAHKWNSSDSLDKASNSTHITRISNGTNHSRKASTSSGNDVRSYKNRNLESEQVSLTKGDHSFSNPDIHSKFVPETNLTRSHSMAMEFPGNIPKHRRQTSLASGSSIQENVIFEDPREHLYNPARSMPFSNYLPSTTSLPVKSTFDIDYSLNLTYAQLTEFRRNKRTTQLEERTGKRLGELEAEISASSILPKSPFDLQNLSGKSSTHSISTGSSDTGVSKSKKKRAPEPPKLQPSFRQRSAELPGTSESTTGFDVNNSSLVNYQNQGKSLQRSVSSASRSSKPPAPQPIAKRLSSASLQGSTSVVNQSPLGPNNLSMSSATLPRAASSNSQSEVTSKEKKTLVTDISVKRSISQAREQLDALKKLQDILMRVEPPETIRLENKMTSASTDVENKMTSASTDLENKRISASTDRADVVIEAVNTIDHETVQDDNGNTLAEDSILCTANQTEVNHTEVNQTEVNQTELNRTAVHQHKVHQTEIHQTEVPQTKVLQPETQQTKADHTSITASDSQSIPDKQVKDFIISSDKEVLLKKMNSVLQRDIVLAAQSRRNKANKKESPSTVAHSESTPDVVREICPKDVITKAENQKNESKNRSIERNADNCYSSKSPDGRNTILQSDFFSITNKPARSDFEDSTTRGIQNQNEIMRTEDSKPLSPLWKHESRIPQVGDEADQEDMSSAASVDISIRSSNQSEDMSISSSNTSQRVFSSDWTPEHDLDPDDDIMDEGYIGTERRISSEGFKPTLIPSKISSLKDSKANRNSKKSKKTESREAGSPQANEKSKFGSIRKFKKSVHQSMRNAFGSISKASGALLSKHKSQDFLDNKERRSQTTTDDSEDDVLESLRNLNWALSSSHSGSLPRAGSDGRINQQHLDYHEESEVSENSDNEIGDIDFAAGINDIPVSHKSSNQSTSAEQKSRVMKRPGVAYVSGKGQIVVLPEYHTVHVDENGRIVNSSLENEGHAPKNYTKKERKYTYESTLRKQEKYKIEEALSRMISEKEQQYEIERLRQKEIEQNFRRLRTLEIQEREQRLKKGDIQEQIAQLQNEQLLMQAQNEQLVKQAQNELNNNVLSLPQMNNLGVVTNGPGTNTSYMNAGTLQLSTPYTLNSKPTISQPDYFNSSISFGNALPVGPQLSYSLPFAPTSSLVQPISLTGMPSTLTSSVNFSHYPAASLVGDRSITGIQGNNISPNLSPQELAFLSDYMWKMGVPPPTTQQQWLSLLSSVAYNATDFPVFGQTQGAFPATESGSDLSQIFGSGKKLNTHIIDTKLEAPAIISNPQSFQTLGSTPVQQLQGEDVTYNNFSLQNANREQSLIQQPAQLAPTSNKINDFAVIKNASSVQPTHNTSTATNTTTNITTAESASTTAHNHSFPEGKTNNIPSINVTNTENLSGAVKTSTQNSVRTHSLPAKVYGPIGYRPVSFNVGSSR